MSSRHYGNRESTSLQRALAVSVVASLGTVVAERISGGLRRLDVAIDNAGEIATACDILRSAALDTTPMAGRRVLVLLLGDGRGVVLGTVGDRDPLLSAQPIEEADPDVARRAPVGSTDRVIEHAGSRIVMTTDGDIILSPKRALRLEGSIVRIEADGDASDSPVTLQPMLAWAQSVENMLLRHESWISANSPFLKVGPTGPTPATPPFIEAEMPNASSAALGASAMRIPTGDS